MSDSEKMEMIHNCLEDLENFTEDLLDDCYVKRGKNVALPECGMSLFPYHPPIQLPCNHFVSVETKL